MCNSVLHRCDTEPNEVTALAACFAISSNDFLFYMQQRKMVEVGLFISETNDELRQRVLNLDKTRRK